jgi:serine protease DegS
MKVKCNDDTLYATAVCIDSNGLFVSNAHVIPEIDGAEINVYIRFTSSEEYEEVNLLKIDRTMDLSLFKLENSDKCVSLNISEIRKTGQRVYAVGNTSNQGVSISEGIITKSSVHIKTKKISMNMIATDAFFAEGNSGGALIDSNNNLLGITTLRLKDDAGNIIYGVGYVIPAEIVLDFISYNNL